jgi:hypothetical protein
MYSQDSILKFSRKQMGIVEKGRDQNFTEEEAPTSHLAL